MAMALSVEMETKITPEYLAISLGYLKAFCLRFCLHLRYAFPMTYHVDKLFMARPT